MENYDEKEMHVIKRNGNKETVSFDKILARVKTLGNEHNININYTNLVIKVIDQLFDGISTSLIDELTAEQAASMSTIHYDYGTLAGILVISNLHKKTTNSFSKAMSENPSFIVLTFSLLQAQESQFFCFSIFTAWLFWADTRSLYIF